MSLESDVQRCVAARLGRNESRSPHLRTELLPVPVAEVRPRGSQTEIPAGFANGNDASDPKYVFYARSVVWGALRARNAPHRARFANGSSRGLSQTEMILRIRSMFSARDRCSGALPGPQRTSLGVEAARARQRGSQWASLQQRKPVSVPL